jgi:hypothetical protein
MSALATHLQALVYASTVPQQQVLGRDKAKGRSQVAYRTPTL